MAPVLWLGVTLGTSSLCDTEPNGLASCHRKCFSLSTCLNPPVHRNNGIRIGNVGLLINCYQTSAVRGKLSWCTWYVYSYSPFFRSRSSGGNTMCLGA
ncbi:hypothetical protein CYLTODRAFT_422030 [Cylindrobasidium torrendii FP15055 ss-10]|uniref:Secreted protein n=1 Tax=Cylindrobasidium torrendii FP15055 ss-10 TaxID=1314674 RepID=A0A0D7BBU9_9AGAR|nr:hypothetical protein CYLTODRAFT_422030 [Cylindrobasidium torrendii FP15055 ss-10]